LTVFPKGLGAFRDLAEDQAAINLLINMV